jgi:hypothetical protein
LLASEPYQVAEVLVSYQQVRVQSAALHGTPSGTVSRRRAMLDLAPPPLSHQFSCLQLSFEADEEFGRYQARQEGGPMVNCHKSERRSNGSSNTQQMSNEKDADMDQGDEAATISWMRDAYDMMVMALQLPDTSPIRAAMLKLASKQFFCHTSMNIMQDFWALQLALQIDRYVHLMSSVCVLIGRPIASASAYHFLLAGRTKTMASSALHARLQRLTLPWSEACSHCKGCTLVSTTPTTWPRLLMMQMCTSGPSKR